LSGIDRWLAVFFLSPIPFFKTSQNHTKTCKNVMIFDKNRSKVNENSSKFEEI
jgi:hypothetical protein